METLSAAQRFTPTLGKKAKFLINISRATVEYRRRFGHAGLPRPTSLLAHWLVNCRGEIRGRSAAAPLLIYGVHEARHASIK